MRGAPARLSPNHAVEACSVFGALVIFSIFPRGLMPVNDGFAYVRSILLTFQHGRPWTDDWLEPWAAGFSSLGAIVLWATHSMYLATYGLSAVLAGIAVWLLAKLLVDRGVAPLLAGIISLVVLLFPTIGWKFVEVNCFSLHLVCLLAVIRAGLKERWGAFLFFWCVALCTRQTAVAWGAVPLLAGISAIARKRPIPWTAVQPWLAIVAAAGWFFVVHGFMNKTHSQRVLTDHLWENWSVSAVYRTAAIGFGVGLAGLGLGSVAVGNLSSLREQRGRLLLAAVLVVISLALLATCDLRQFIGFDDDAFELRFFRIYPGIATAAAALGLATLRADVSRPLIGAAVAAVAIITVRNVTWDYYLADAFLFSFFAVTSKPRLVPRRRMALAAFLAALLFSMCFVVHFKAKCDRTYAIGTLGRLALEKGVVSPAEASFLPFGLMAWYYFPYYAQHDGATTADIAGFGNRMKQNTFEVAVRYPWPLRRLPEFRSSLPDDRSAVAAEGRFNFCWFTYADYRLSRAAPERVRPGTGPFPADFKLPVFPADDRAWWELAQSGDEPKKRS